MPLDFAIQDYQPPRMAFVSQNASAIEAFKGYFDFEPLHTLFQDRLEVANVIYPLRRDIKARYLPVHGEFIDDSFGSVFTGHGNTIDEAMQDWMLKIHEAFQSLSVMRPFEMSKDELLRWERLNSVIDVSVYRNRTPITFKQLGKVNKLMGMNREIKWDDGTTEQVSLTKVSNSPDFVSFKVGQPIEATVLRSPVDLSLIEISDLRRTRELLPVTKDAATEFLRKINSSDTLTSTKL